MLFTELPMRALKAFSASVFCGLRFLTQQSTYCWRSSLSARVHFYIQMKRCPQLFCCQLVPFKLVDFERWQEVCRRHGGFCFDPCDEESCLWLFKPSVETEGVTTALSIIVQSYTPCFHICKQTEAPMWHTCMSAVTSWYRHWLYFMNLLQACCRRVQCESQCR